MEPRIQYARTKDGVSIAYWTLGDGPPFVSMPFLPSQLQLAWQIPEYRAWAERMAQKRQFVEYAARATGLSDRDVSDFSLDAFLLDLEAVVDRLGLERFALFAPFLSGPVSIAYTCNHTERVTHLILWCTGAHGADMIGPRSEAIQPMAAVDWDMALEVWARLLLGWSAAEKARQYAAMMRDSITPEGFQGVLAAATDIDVAGLLAKVRSPTMILQRRRIHGRGSSGEDTARDLASRIPDASLVLLEGDSWSPMLGDTEAVHRAIGEFLGDGDEVSARREPSAFRTILFTDIEGSTALADRLGDARAQELRRAHDTIVREALKGCGGSETKHTGDGIMASFPSASRAIECAVAVQRAIAERGDEMLRVRIGLNAGEPVAEEADLFGTAVNLARRICDRAEPGQILVSDVVHQLAAGKGFTFADNGEATLKGFEKAVRLHEVRWREE